MHAGMQVLSTDLLQTPGYITSANRVFVSIRWQDGRMEEIGRDVVAATLTPVAKRLVLTAKESVWADSRDTFPSHIRGNEYEAWDDGATLWLGAEYGTRMQTELSGAERVNALMLFDQVEGE